MSISGFQWLKSVFFTCRIATPALRPIQIPGRPSICCLLDSVFNALKERRRRDSKKRRSQFERAEVASFTSEGLPKYKLNTLELHLRLPEGFCWDKCVRFRRASFEVLPKMEYLPNGKSNPVNMYTDIPILCYIDKAAFGITVNINN